MSQSKQVILNIGKEKLYIPIVHLYSPLRSMATFYTIDGPMNITFSQIIPHKTDSQISTFTTIDNRSGVLNFECSDRTKKSNNCTCGTCNDHTNNCCYTGRIYNSSINEVNIHSTLCLTSVTYTDKSITTFIPYNDIFLYIYYNNNKYYTNRADYGCAFDTRTQTSNCLALHSENPIWYHIYNTIMYDINVTGTITITPCP